MWKGRRHEDKPGQEEHLLLLSSGNFSFVPSVPEFPPKSQNPHPNVAKSE